MNFGIKSEPGMGDVEMMSRGVKTEDGGYISSDEDEMDVKGMGRLNVDDLGVIDLTQEDEEADPTRSFAPVRLKREAHKDRTLGLNADGATTQDPSIASNDLGDPGGEKRKGKQRAKDVEVTGESEKFQGTYSSSSENEQDPTIKAEPTDEDERAGTPEPVQRDPMLTQEMPSSPESKRKAKEKIKSNTLAGSAPERPVHQTQEEVDEWERHQSDLQLLYSELGTLTLPPQPDRDGDAAMVDAQQQQLDKKADKVYLFQFPPVLPDLLPIAVKPDPEAPPPADGQAMDVDKQPNNSSNPVTVSDDTSGQPRPPKLPSGAVGKLKIHKSGKATLDWGGTSLCVGMGAEASFLQDVLVASLPEHKVAANGGDGGGEVESGVAMAMGQVKGKFIVTPDWEEILR